MSAFIPQKFNLSDINNGERFENGQKPEEIAFNAPIEGSAYAIAKADDAIAKADDAIAKADQAINIVGDNILDKELGPLVAYPIGSYYISENPTSPAVLFGGSWVQVTDRFLVGAGNIYALGSTGGSAEHTLTIDEMPSHKHQLESGVGVDWSNQGVTTNPITFKAEISNGRNIESKAVGGGLPHNNIPPYLAVFMWKRIAQR